MKFLPLFLTLSVSLTLSGCGIKAPQEISATEKSEVKCAIASIPEGYKCENLTTVASFLVPEVYEVYGTPAEGNYMDPTKNSFLHTAAFPLAAFDESSQKLLKENKIKEYIQYEQTTMCKPNPDCTTEVKEDSFGEVTLGENQWFKYNVHYKNEAEGFDSIHYATLMNDFFVDFSSSKGEMIPSPPLSKNLVKSVTIEDKTLEQILSSLTAQKK